MKKRKAVYYIPSPVSEKGDDNNNNDDDDDDEVPVSILIFCLCYCPCVCLLEVYSLPCQWCFQQLAHDSDLDCPGLDPESCLYYKAIKKSVAECCLVNVFFELIFL